MKKLPTDKSAIHPRLTSEQRRKVQKGETVIILARAWEEDGVWNLSAFDLPVAVFGNSFEEARKSFDDAIYTHFHALNELGKVKNTIKQLQRMARDRGFYKERILERDRREKEVVYPLLRSESEMLYGASA